MGKGPKLTFFQRRHTNGQQVDEKMLSITNHKGNANQKHNEIAPHTSQNDYNQKDKNCVGEKEEKREPLCTVGGNVNWYSTMGNSMGVPQKNRNRTMIQSSSSTPGYLSKENENTNSKRYMHSNVHSSIIYNSQDTEAT